MIYAFDGDSSNQTNQTKMPHSFTTPAPGPVKRAITISHCTIMKDGGWIDWNNHFNVRGSKSSSQEDLNEALKKTCQYIVCRDTLKRFHDVYGEQAYYINLGMSDPYRDFEDFREYAKQAILENEPSYMDKATSGYLRLCEINNVDEGGELF